MTPVSIRLRFFDNTPRERAHPPHSSWHASTLSRPLLRPRAPQAISSSSIPICSIGLRWRSIRRSISAMHSIASPSSKSATQWRADWHDFHLCPAVIAAWMAGRRPQSWPGNLCPLPSLTKTILAHCHPYSLLHAPIPDQDFVHSLISSPWKPSRRTPQSMPSSTLSTFSLNRLRSTMGPSHTTAPLRLTRTSCGHGRQATCGGESISFELATYDK